MSEAQDQDPTPTPGTDKAGRETAGEMVEDIVEGTISEASPSESTKDDGGTEEANREGHRYQDGSAFNA